MENEEIIEEYSEVSNEDLDSSDMDMSVSENEEDLEITQEQFVDTLLDLVTERLEENAIQDEESSEDDSEVLDESLESDVSSYPSPINYTDDLLAIGSRLNYVNENLEALQEETGWLTPLNEYTLTDFLLLVIILLLGLRFAYQVFKDFILNI